MNSIMYLKNITLNNSSFEFSEYKENIEIFEFVIKTNKQFIILKQLTVHLILFYVISNNTPKQT